MRIGEAQPARRWIPQILKHLVFNRCFASARKTDTEICGWSFRRAESSTSIKLRFSNPRLLLNSAFGSRFRFRRAGHASLRRRPLECAGCHKHWSDRAGEPLNHHAWQSRRLPVRVLTPDFLISEASAREFRAISALYQDGVLPIEVVFTYMRNAGEIPSWIGEERFKQMLEARGSFPNQADVQARQAGFTDAAAQREAGGLLN